MYLISAYFDDVTTEKLQKYIDDVATASGNTFMIDNNVPPHMTILSIEARNELVLMNAFKEQVDHLSKGEILIPTIGQLLPYVMYAGVVMNSYLSDMQKNMMDAMKDIDEVSFSKFYQPDSWLPHITLGKTLTPTQMTDSFNILHQRFSPIQGTIVELGLARTNPHRDILRFEL
jgi:hypothetical protein